MIRRAKSSYYASKFLECKTDMRKTWKVINSVIRPSSHSPDIPTKLDIDGVLIEGPCEIKNSLASYFASVGEKTVKGLGGSAISLAQDQHLKFMGPPCLKSIVIKLVLESEVARHIQGLKVASPSGPDYISTKAVQAIFPSILGPITKLFNMSFEKGKFPRSLKTARVIALFKGGNKSDPSNYRPISLLSVFSKIFEKPMLFKYEKRLTRFLQSNEFLHSHQFGFRSKHTTEQACTTLISFLHTALDSGKIPAAIFLDVRKAFDGLTHKILLDKLSHIGIRGSALSWFRSCLHDRSISMDPDSLKSIGVDYGVPQGSILGPTLF